MIIKALGKTAARYFVGCLAFTGLFFSCNDNNEENILMEGEIKFDISPIIDVDVNGRKSEIDLKKSFLIIGIEDMEGNKFDVFFAEILKFQGQHFTPTIKLPSGQYKVTNLSIADADQDYDIIYAVPREGSTLSGMVETTVPFEIEIFGGEVSNYTVDLLSVEGFDLEDFGFAKVNLNLVNLQYFDIGVYAYNESEGINELIGADLKLKINDNVIYRKWLARSVNTIPITEGLEQEEVEIEILRDGYKTEVRKEIVGKLLQLKSTGLVYDIYLEKE